MNDARREAYRYILERLSMLPPGPASGDSFVWIPLDELKLLKEGVSGPSAALVASLTVLLQDVVSPEELRSHLVDPFVVRGTADTGKV